MNFTILIDTREQTPLVFTGLTTARATLTTGDYSCICDGVDLRDVVAIERKSLSNRPPSALDTQNAARKCRRLAC